MKKTFFLTFFSFLPLFLSAWECPSFNCFTQGVSLEVKGAYYLPTSRLMREIYNENRGLYSIEIAKELSCNLHAWTEVGFMKQDGHSLGLGEATSLRLIPWTFGLKYLYKITPSFTLYGGLGGAFSWLHIHNNTTATTITKNTSKQRVGAVARTGLLYEINASYYLDAFTNYLYLPFDLTSVNNLGGFTFGGGIGVKF